MTKQLLGLFLMILVHVGCSATGAMQTSGTGPARATIQEGQEELPIPAPKDATDKAPDTFRVKFETTKGDFVIEVTRAWSPNGADRFYNLVKVGYFKDVVIFRAIKGFMFQFGVHGDPKVNEVWSEATIQDDKNVGQPNVEGTITFAKSGLPNSRSVQFFINLGDNRRLDSDGFTPFGKVVEGAIVLKQINTQYGENERNDQDRFQAEGNAYILKKYPNLDVIKSIKLSEDQ